MTKNPFSPASPVSKRLKILLFGPSGGGKTIAALSFPRCAVIDSEGGTDLYAGRPGTPAFSVLRAKTVTELEQAIAFIREDNGKTFETLVIDPMTVFYDVQKDAASRTTKDGSLSPREWSRINNRMKAIYNSLTNLPVHVVVIARESTEYEGSGNDFRKVGVKPDSDKALPYVFDITVHVNPDHTGTVVKSRGYPLGPTLPKVDWSVFEPVASAYTDGESIQQKSEVEAGEDEADLLWDDETIASFVKSSRESGIANGELLKALGVAGLREWKSGRKAAEKRVSEWIEEQVDAEVNAHIARDGK